jgi:hypothetical protein
MAKTIIGIHGLANKPPADDLKVGWRKAIDEGLKKNCKVENPEYEFHLVYWANYLYRTPMHEDPDWKFDDQYNWEPYREAEPDALEEYEPGIGAKIFGAALWAGGEIADFAKETFGIGKFADFFLSKYLKDLHYYYDEDRKLRADDGELKQARVVIQTPLVKALDELAGPDVMLVAHSMGSIIAYDVLRDLGRTNPDAEVPQFVTIGSPLGLPHVMQQIKEERSYHAKEEGKDRVRTPTVVTGSWVNYADRKDPVALDAKLRDDFGKNGRGIRVKDDLVQNDYSIPDGKDRKYNHHKSYGYLRTPEFSKQIAAFL